MVSNTLYALKAKT
ncbi:hypothetical protein S7711_11585 [Stachybotrys chartarum IBT 7711]|uniref:Uncharacterized protein n=1 Tax=Stachybotrys chartarum (strain CBS 109288 / IBT 7711) TaxID=1280523 RepID=A0A084B6R3_STACB|nr:hypothetical protein S7711_11585 [Stachybotrys chartarum IBT 7711]